METEMETQEFNFIALPDHIKADIISNCNFKTLMKITETCKHLNEFVFSRNANRIIFKVHYGKPSENQNPVQRSCNHNLDDLLASSRAYRNIRIAIGGVRDLDANKKLLKHFTVKGSFLKDLEIENHNWEIVYTINHELLVHCPNLEKLSIDYVQFQRRANYRNLSLPKLKTLKLSHWTQVQVFGNVKGLEDLSIVKTEYSDEDNYGPSNFSTDSLERFIFQQHNLKTLDASLEGLTDFLLSTSKIREVKFKLEELRISSSAFNKGAAVKFFRKQRTSLKKVDLCEEGYIDSKLFVKILAEVLTLPKMVELRMGRSIYPEEFVKLQDIRNESVKTVAFMYYFPGLEKIAELLPNLEEIEFIDRVYHFDFSLPSNVLPKIRADVAHFSFQPSDLYEDPETVAENLLKFCENNLDSWYVWFIDSIKAKIGDESWIGNFSLPQSFWTRFLNLRLSICKIKAYNVQREDLDMQLLEGHRSLDLFTGVNAAGEQEVMFSRYIDESLEFSDID